MKKHVLAALMLLTCTTNAEARGTQQSRRGLEARGAQQRGSRHRLEEGQQALGFKDLEAHWPEEASNHHDDVPSVAQEGVTGDVTGSQADMDMTVDDNMPTVMELTFSDDWTGEREWTVDGVEVREKKPVPAEETEQEEPTVDSEPSSSALRRLETPIVDMTETGQCYKIISEQTCRKWAEDGGYKLQISNSPRAAESPKGCYLYKKPYTPRVVYNANGAADCTSDRVCLCKPDNWQTGVVNPCEKIVTAFDEDKGGEHQAMAACEAACDANDLCSYANLEVFFVLPVLLSEERLW